MQMLQTPVAMKTACNGVLASLDPAIPEGGQLFRAALSGNDCPHNLHAGNAGNITDDVRQLDVHLARRFLHAVERLGLIAHLAAPLAH